MKRKYIEQFYFDLNSIHEEDYKRVNLSKESEKSILEKISKLIFFTIVDEHGSSIVNDLADVIRKHSKNLRSEIINLLKNSYNYKDSLEEVEFICREYCLIPLINECPEKTRSDFIISIFETFGCDFSYHSQDLNKFFNFIRIYLKDEKDHLIIQKIFNLSKSYLDNKNEYIQIETLRFQSKLVKSFPFLKEQILEIMKPYFDDDRVSFVKQAFLCLYKLSKEFDKEMIDLINSYQSHSKLHVQKIASETLMEIKKVKERRKLDEEDAEYADMVGEMRRLGRELEILNLKK